MTTPNPALTTQQPTATTRLADVLDNLAAIASSVGDGGRPSDNEHPCVMCHLKVTETREHEPWCGYQLARGLSYNDLEQVRRLARVLRFDG